MGPEIPNPDDRLFQRSSPESEPLRAFLRQSLPPPVLAAMDLDTLQRLEGGVVEEALRPARCLTPFQVLRAARSGVLGGLIGVAVVPGNPPWPPFGKGGDKMSPFPKGGTYMRPLGNVGMTCALWERGDNMSPLEKEGMTCARWESGQ